MNGSIMNKQMGTKWFTFYTKVRPWLACLTVLSVLVDFANYVDVYIKNFFLLLYFAMSITQGVLAVIVAVKADEDYANFVKFVKKVLLFETINIAYQQGINQYIQNEFDFEYALLIFVILLFIGYFTWYRLNVKYFEKRVLNKFDGQVCNNTVNNDCTPDLTLHDLSQDQKTTTITIENLKIESTVVTKSDIEPCKLKIRFCRQCGHELLDNANFCNICGTQTVLD